MLGEASGKFKELRLDALIETLIIIVGGVIGTIFFGLEGMLIAAILSNIYRFISLIFFIPKNIVGLSKVITLKRVITIFVCIGTSILTNIICYLSTNNTMELDCLCFSSYYFCMYCGLYHKFNFR